MDLRFSEEDENFRREVAAWLEENLSGEFAVVRGRGGTGDEGCLIEERKAWERRLGEGGWIGLGWPTVCCRDSATSAKNRLRRGPAWASPRMCSRSLAMHSCTRFPCAVGWFRARPGSREG